MNGPGFNPYYGQQYMPQPQYPQTYFPNQEIQNFQQKPQFQNQNFPRGIFGRIVSNPSEITPNEISMDGSISIFPLTDYSKIYAKQWMPDGTIRTLEFVPKVEKEEPSAQSTNDDIKSYFDAKFKALSDSINEIKKPAPKTTTR